MDASPQLLSLRLPVTFAQVPLVRVKAVVASVDVPVEQAPERATRLVVELMIRRPLSEVSRVVTVQVGQAAAR